MRLKKKLSKDCLLCVILDREFLSAQSIIASAEKALMAGADMVQLRDKRSSVKDIYKTAKRLKSLTKRFNVPLVINDRLDVAIAVDSDALHVGQGDISVRLARRLFGRDKIIGASAGNLRQAARARGEGASYIGIGPIFKTPLKASREAVGVVLLKKAAKLNIPLIAIGGINEKNISALAKSGFRNAAVIRAVCASRDPFAATKRLKKALVQ